jgi:hypothetical protein
VDDSPIVDVLVWTLGACSCTAASALVGTDVVDLDRANKGYNGEWDGERTGLSARTLSLVIFLRELIFFIVEALLWYVYR